MSKYVIKRLVNNIFPDEDMAYFIGIEDDVLWNNQAFVVRRISTTNKSVTNYNSNQDTLDSIQEHKLHSFNIFPICPRCNKEYAGYPVISSVDNKIEICSKCGVEETLNKIQKYI